MRVSLPDLRIGTRVALALALPLCGLFALSFWVIAGYYGTARDMERMRNHAGIAPAVRSLIHALQLERGISANYVSATQAAATGLESRYQDTALRQDEFRRLLQDSGLGNAGGGIADRISIIVEKLERMDNWRQAVTQRRATVTELTGFYGDLILELIGLIEEMRTLSSSVELTRTISAFTRIMHAKELAGLERAIGVAGFASGRFDQLSHARFIQLIERQRLHHEDFWLVASPQQAARLAQAFAGFDAAELERMRRVVINSQGLVATSGVNAQHWWEVASQKIDLLKTVEDSIDRDLISKVQEAEDAARLAAWRISLLALVLLVLTVALAWRLARSIIEPLTRITRSMSQLAARDGSIEIADDRRHDEIGDMARALIVFRENLIEVVYAEERLKNEAILRLHHEALATISQGVLITDAERRITYANAAFQNITGYTEEEILGVTPAFLHKLGGDEKMLGELRDALQDAQPFHANLLNYRKDGTPFWSDLSVTPVFDAQGQPTHFVGVTRDVTESRLMQQELRIAAAAFESLHGIMVTDAHGIILRVNQAFTEITGYSADEVVGHSPAILKSGHHPPEFYAQMWQQLSTTGGWYGEIWDRRKNGEVFPKWQTISAVRGIDERTTHFVAAFSDISENKAAENEIRNLAFYDPLTQLPNRRLLIDRLQHALSASARSRRVGALLFIDLDNFKNLNDTFGHDKGDLLLQQVAQRLTACVREDDTVARLGGDEFVLMLEDLSSEHPEAAAHTELVGEKILAALNQPYQLASLEYHSTPSIGVTLFCGHDKGIDELMKQADLAMYQSKSAGRNALRFFEPTMQATVSARAAMEAELRRGLRDAQFVLYYQPQVNHAGALTGFEALVRWQHPQRGLVPPNEFIPLAEDTGLILPLGQWVMESACAQIARWSTDASTAALSMAINVSARQFGQEKFVDQAMDIFTRTGADPHRLKMELTESLFLDNVEEAIAKMLKLRRAGVSFSLDDFGTGYSSLSYLKRLPIDQLKIDRSFVRDVLEDPNDATIARTIVALGQSLGLSIIAEGVETDPQRAFLAASGCVAYQGFLYSEPLAADELEVFLKQRGE